MDRASMLIRRAPNHQRNVTDIFFRNEDKVRSKTPFEKKMDNMSIEGRSNYSRNNKDSCVLGCDKFDYFKTSYKESQSEIEKEANKQRALAKPKNDEVGEGLPYYPKVNMLLRMKTTGGLFIDKKTSRENRVELYKSNIFNDPQKDIMNKTFTITSDILKQEKEKDKVKTLNPIRNIRRRMKSLNDYDDNDCNGNQSNASNMKRAPLTARERKEENNKGHFPSQYNDYKPMEPPKEMTSVDEMKKKEIMSKYNGITENQRKIEDFVVTGNTDIDLLDIQKVFHQNGLHIFNEKDNTSYYDGQNRRKITFKIRACEEDKTYSNKVDQVRKYLKKNKGLMVKKVDPLAKEYYYKGYCETQPNYSRTSRKANGDDDKPKWKY